MKYIGWSLVVLFSSCSPQKTDKNILIEVLTCSTDTSCYIEKATTDFNTGNLILFSSGLIETGSFSYYYGTYLEQHMHLNIVWGGDAFNPFLEYYNRTMISDLKKKYGEDFFLNAKRRTIEMYHVRTDRNELELFHCN